MEVLITYTIYLKEHQHTDRIKDGKMNFVARELPIDSDMLDSFDRKLNHHLCRYLTDYSANSDFTELTQLLNLDNAKPEKCPVCEGRGIMPNNFYTMSQFATTDASPVTCKSCNGKGYV